MKEYLEDLKVGGRPMTDKELADHYKHLYSEVKKQKDDAVKYVNSISFEGSFTFVRERANVKYNLLRMLGEIDE